MKDYYLQSPEDIVDDLKGKDREDVEIDNYSYQVSSESFPSHLFRTTALLKEAVQELCVGKRVCDMGCSYGLIGLQALLNGANYCVFVDHNPVAVLDVQENIQRFGFVERTDVYQSDVFTSVPEQLFDLIIFNPPFHTEKQSETTDIVSALYDSGFRSMKLFLEALPRYTRAGSKVIIAFSDKGNVTELESLFEQYEYGWHLWKRVNQEQKYHKRLYLIEL